MNIVSSYDNIVVAVTEFDHNIFFFFSRSYQLKTVYIKISYDSYESISYVKIVGVLLVHISSTKGKK